MNIIEIDKRLPNMCLCIVCDAEIYKPNVRTHLTSKYHNINILLEHFSDHFESESAKNFIESHREICNTDEVIKYIHIRRLIELRT